MSKYITEDYVSFEIAKFLKEKGFDERCFCINYPLSEGGHHNIILPNLLNNSTIPLTNEYKFCRYKEDFITIPTLQMVMKWLREVHKILITIIPQEVNVGIDRMCYGIYRITEDSYIPLYNGKVDNLVDSYEKVVEAAIKYVLENLI